MSKTYDPTHWFWLADDGRIAGSSTGLVQDGAAAYEAWTAGGGIATPWPKDAAGAQTNAALNDVLAPYGLSVGGPVQSIADVSSAQAKIQLLRASFLTPVKETVAVLGGEVEIWFNEARTWQRSNPHVVSIGSGLHLSETEIDDLFRAAALIDA